MPTPQPTDLSSVAYLARDVVYTMFFVGLATLAILGGIYASLLGLAKLIEKWELWN